MQPIAQLQAQLGIVPENMPGSVERGGSQRAYERERLLAAGTLRQVVERHESTLGTLQDVLVPSQLARWAPRC